MIKKQHIPILVTLSLLVLMFLGGSLRYTGFFSWQVLLNLLIDNAFLLIVAIGLTFVILTGGIDLSVGSVIALTSMISAVLLEKSGWPPYLVIPLVLVIGALMGAGMGAIIHYFHVQPFIATLAGMFLARGLSHVISTNSIPIDDPYYVKMAQTRIMLPGGNFISISVIIALVLLVVALFLAHFTRFGRNVYAIGGNEQSAILMGLPVGRTKVLVYTFSGFCSALAGVVFTFYMLSGYSLHALGLELDAIAAVVIGGTLMTGGYGSLIGTFFGVLLQGLIQTMISFEGTLSSWWTKIVIGALLFLFILLQRVLVVRNETREG